MGDCKHPCDKTPVFPVDIGNRPALDTIDYRIGTYSSMREHLLDSLNRSSELNAWTHRGADDPGIALLEGTAIVGDILTYYQSLYGNEAFLRTARWQESIGDLVRLLGYRLSPGVGGEAVFAVKVKGNKAVTVPAGFGFKAKLEGQDADSVFESSAEALAWPHLSKFHLYRPPQSGQSIQAGGNQLELKAVAGAEDLTSIQSVDISKGDRIMLVPDASMFDENINYTAQGKSEILIVSEVETLLDRVVVTFDGNLSETRTGPVTAYKIDRTFKHFGYNAANKFNTFDDGVFEQEDTVFDRDIGSQTLDSVDDSGFTPTEMPLDQEVGDLALGGKLICQGQADFTGQSAADYTVVREIKQIQPDALIWGGSAASASVLTMKTPLIPNETLQNVNMDIRKARFHEVISQELRFDAPAKWDDGMFSESMLQFFGTFEEAKALAGRSLLLVNEQSGHVQSVTVNNSVADFETILASTSKDAINQWMWDITLDSVPEFKQKDFDQLDPAVIVYGNQVLATQGKTEKEAVLGSGDNRLTFQSFPVPQAPLTYLLDDNRTPAEAPELDVYVEGMRWELVDTFFGSAPDAKIYVVRQDNDGNSLIQFGDGKTGARLPSGRNNVTALYRTGIGAAGSLEEGAKAKGTGKLKALDDVFMPIAAVGGAEAESGEGARDAAPGKIQSLDRLVGLADFESEALAITGVIKVRADWSAASGVPLVRLVVLSETAEDAAIAKVQDTMNGFNRSRGAARFPVQIVQGSRKYLYLSVRAGYMPSYRPENIEPVIKEALGLSGEEGNGVDSKHGLFSLENRSFGQGAHRSQVEAVIQQVEGVSWVEIDDAQPLDAGEPPESDPANIPKPLIACSDKVLLCPATAVLALHTVHFDLKLVADKSSRECKL